MKAIWMIILLFPLLSHAMESAENDRLARISRELQYIETMVSDAQKQADQSGRVRFDYDALMLDLKRIRLGIDEYTHRIQREPETLSPVSGDYME